MPDNAAPASTPATPAPGAAPDPKGGQPAAPASAATGAPAPAAAASTAPDAGATGGQDAGGKEPKPWKRPTVKVRGYVREVSARPAAKPAPASAAADGQGSAAAGTPVKPEQPKPTDASAAPGSSATPAKPETPAAKPADQATEGEKKPPLSRGWAELLERENKVTQAQAALKQEQTTYKPYAEAAEKAKTSVLDAIEHLYGADALDRAMAESLQRSRGTQSPEAIARAAAKAELDAREQARKDADAAAQKEREEAAKTESQQKIASAAESLRTAAAAMPAEDLRGLNAFGLQPVHTLQFYVQKHNAWPTDFAAAVREHEAFCREQLKANGFDIPAPPPAPAPAPAAVEAPAKPEKRTPAVRPKPSATITPDDTGSVPLRPVRKETAIERVRRIAAEHNARN